MLLILVVQGAVAQKKLLLLKRQRVLAAWQPGDYIRWKHKENPQITRAPINNLLEFAVVFGQDTVPFSSIERLYVEERTFTNRLGTQLVVAGGLLLVIDQANQLIQGNDLNLDAGVTRVSAAAVVAGLPLMFIRKRSQRIGYPYRLRMVTPGHPQYPR